MSESLIKLQELPCSSLPQHVAIIMDGNGRWAQKQGRSRTYGLQAGFSTVRTAVRCARKAGIQSLTLFAFSTENWNRPSFEVDFIMKLLVRGLTEEAANMSKHGIKLNIIGDRRKFSSYIQEKMRLAEEMTSSGSELTVNIAVNYGGQWDLLQATQSIVKDIAAKKLQPEDVNEALYASKLSLSDQAPVDLLIRTSGEYRISNFVLWQAAYAEFYFLDLFWPDFDEEAFTSALQAYAMRQRRFGLTGDQVN